MSKWLPPAWLVLLVALGLTGMFALNMWGKVATLKQETAALTKQVKAEQAKTQAVIEEWNALKKIQDDGERNKDKIQEKTDAAKASHVKSGVPVYASKHDAGLLRQRSIEVRGETTGDTSQADR